MVESCAAGYLIGWNGCQFDVEGRLKNPADFMDSLKWYNVHFPICFGCTSLVWRA